MNWKFLISNLSDRLGDLKSQLGQLCEATARTASRMVYQAAYVAALVIPGTSRQRRNRAKVLAAKAEENAQKHAPAGIAVLINGLFLFFIGTIKLRQDRERDPDAITATIDTEGFFSRPILPEPPGGGGGGGQSINAALAQSAAVPTVNVTIPNDVLTAITTTAPAVFEVPTMVSSVTDLATKAMNSKPAGGTGGGQGGGNGTGTGTGNGSGQGTGSGTGIGDGHGAGIGDAMREETYLIVVDLSSSMKSDQGKVQQVLSNILGSIDIYKSKTVYCRSAGASSIATLIETVEDQMKNWSKIIWITDLEDSHYESKNAFGVKSGELTRLLLKNGQKLAIHSTKFAPAADLMPYIDNSSIEYHGELVTSEKPNL
jgi:hypothetical protein